MSYENQVEVGLIKPVLVSGNFGLVAKGVGKSFNKRRVVRNVSIELQRGEAVGLLGPNGAGKTTTFYMLAGLLPTDEGQVFLDGRNVTGMPIFQRARLGLGYLPQESSIFRQAVPTPVVGTPSPWRSNGTHFVLKLGLLFSGRSLYCGVSDTSDQKPDRTSTDGTIREKKMLG